MILRLYIVDKIHRNVIKAVVSNTRQWNLPWMDDLTLPAVVYFFKLYYLKKHVIYLSHPNQAIASFLFQFRFELSWGKKIECLSFSVRQSFNVKLRFFYCYCHGAIHAKGEIFLLYVVYMYIREIGNTQIWYYWASKIKINGILFNAILVRPLTLEISELKWLICNFELETKFSWFTMGHF